MLIAENISYARGKKQILEKVSLQLEPGVFTAVLGPNGAGKSTLLKLVSKETGGHTGSIRLNGKSLADYTARELALVRAVLPQSVHVNFPFKAREIVQLGRLPHREALKKSIRVTEEVMDATGIRHLADRNYASLSGGEQQRVQLARVIAQLKGSSRQPRFLLLDEPTSSLDMAQQHSMLHIAREMCRQDIGVLAILHDMNLAAQYADELLFLKKGKTVAQGRTADLMQEEVLEATFAHPVQVMCHGCSNRPFVMAIPYHQSQKVFQNIIHK
ncbi:heme ABC transporter ATP-binding protein [Pontibacter sp. SGAir0037]|uniref:heme ABC transporter ATP-binding protein n=1 Tax=Pontibacter sp. SGAir0037 TaxID=2571030 RepID=UPI0010CD1777|nr:heme ABC transporter ATP-binding protein [Pontibacter sp. SGAir0037]QCR21139.1 heme ABC transporter ATP-binding protein [Pontibacter sp. SGAir0037]